MKLKRNSLFLLLAIAILTGLGCATFVVIRLLDARPGSHKSKCESPPNLTAANLVGTWIAGLTNESDTLVLREDNKYKQIIVSKRRNIDYRTDWQDWWLEQDKDGLVYLHLQGMRTCGLSALRNCEDVDYNGYDFCQDRSILMKGQGILLVLDDQNSATGFDLSFPLGSEETWVYWYQKP